MKADFRQINEKLENKIDSINENSKKQNEILSENLVKQMNKRFDRNDESLRQILENTKRMDEKIENHNKELRQIINEQGLALREETINKFSDYIFAEIN